MIVLAALLGCSERPPNVLLYVVDTLRADALRPYGNEAIDTPVLEGLAREGILFENVYAASSWTRPAITSILTGLRPERHGVETRTDGLREQALLLSERFREHGYSTGAVVTNPNVASFFGFDQGYGDYVELYDRKDAGYVASEELVADSAMVSDRAIQWIDQTEEPFFLFVLATDPHWPYLPPERFDRYGGDYHGQISGSDFALRASELSQEDRDRMRSLYYGEIAFLDESLGRLLGHLRERGIYDDTIVALTSDHGEEFWEHGIRGHGGSLFEPVLRVPLILHGPGVEPAGTRVSRIVESIDIVPTLLELAKLPPPAGIDGRNVLAEGAPRETYLSLDLDGTRLKGVVDYPWKLIWDEARSRKTLTDLASDPDEEVDLLDSEGEVARRLSSLLNERLESDHADRARLSKTVFESGQRVPQDVLEALVALGYAEDGSQTGGLSGAYYLNPDWQGDPLLRRTDGRIDFHWLEPPWTIPPPFSIEWTGALKVSRPGRYGFALESDDGSVLEIDGEVVVDNGGDHSVRRREADVQLAQGSHAVRLRYYNRTLGGVVRMLWTPPGDPEELVPADALTPSPTDRGRRDPGQTGSP